MSKVERVDLMGIPALSRRILPGLLVLASFVLTGCPTDRNPRQISSVEFIAPKQTTIRELSDKVDLGKAIFPTELTFNEIVQMETNTVPLALLTSDRLLLWEAKQNAMVSADICAECSDSSIQRSRIRLHWNEEGLERELFDSWGIPSIDPTISFDTVGDSTQPGVTPIMLRGESLKGWMLAVEGRNGDLLAFKADPTFRINRPLDHPRPEDDPNFGFGNGVVMAVVISRQEMVQQIGAGDARISRIVEIEDGKILVFFTTVREIHLLVIEPAERELVFSRLTEEQEDAGLEPIVRTITYPRGTFQLFGPNNIDGELCPTAEPCQPFMSFRRIQENITQDVEINLDGFQPMYLPPTNSNCAEGTLPAGREGSVLVFDAGSRTFLRFWQDLRPTIAAGEQGQIIDNPRLGRGRVSALVTNETLTETVGVEPYFFEAAFLDDCSTVVAFDETSNNLLQIDITDAPTVSGKVDIPAGSVDFLLRRRPVVVSGEDVVPSSEEPILKAAQDNLLENRIYFDQGQDQLVSVHLDTKNVVVVADRANFESATGSPLANVTYIEQLDGVEDDPNLEIIRVWDTESTSLIDIQVRYVSLPVRDEEAN